MNVLVTGAAGFIGSHLVEALIKKGYTVTCLTRKTSDRKWLEPAGVSYIFSDLADTNSYEGKVKGFDYVFHLAGRTKALSNEQYFTDNAENTRKFLEVICRDNPNVRRFVFLSSLAAGGPSNNGIPVREGMPPQPVSLYGKSKLVGEQAVMKHSGRIPITVIRAPAVYGPRDTDFLVLFQTIKKGFFPYWGKCYYSLLYVEDLVNGIILSAERDEGKGEIYYLSDNMIYSNVDLVQEISSALNAEVMKIRIPVILMPLIAFVVQNIDKKGIINTDRIRDFRYSHWTCDSRKAHEKLGFQASISLKEGIQWTADWYKIHQWL